MVINPKSIGSILVVALIAIVVGGYLVLVYLFQVSWVDAFGVTGWIVGMISLILYLQDRFEIQPVFLQIRYSPVQNSPRKYLIEANISNEGNMDIRSNNATVTVTGEGVQSTPLNRVVVEGPRGAIRAEPPHDLIQKFPLYSKRPVWTRGYVEAPENTLVTVTLKVREAEFEKVAFHLSHN